jgi:ABC-type glycerol-3-phosphate transport system substrate-binding protein
MKTTAKISPVTITYAVWDSNQAKGIRKMADEFEKANPGIKIKIEVNGWSDYWTALEAGATGGSLPDTFWMHSNEIYKFASNGMLLNLNDKIKASKKITMSSFPKGLTSIYNFKGNQYAVPKDYDTIGLWYNKTMFDKAGVAYPNESWKWVEYLGSKEGQLRQAQLGVAISAYNGTSTAWVASNKIFNIKVFIDMVKYAQIRPYSNTTAVWEDKAYEALKGAFTGDKTVEAACKDAANVMNESLAAEK